MSTSVYFFRAPAEAVLGRRVRCSLDATGTSPARKKIDRNKYTSYSFHVKMRNIAAAGGKPNKTRGPTKKNSLFHEVPPVVQQRKKTKPRRRPLLHLRAVAFISMAFCVAVFALILLQGRFYLPVQYHHDKDNVVELHAKTSSRRSTHIHSPTFFAYASPAPATNAELVQLGEKFRERCITCQAKSKLLAVSKRLPDRHSWISRMNKAAKICVDLYTNVLIYEATHLGTACGNHEAPVNVLQIFEVKIPDAILYDNTTIKGNATVLDQVLNLNAVVVVPSASSGGASNASAALVQPAVLNVSSDLLQILTKEQTSLTESLQTVLASYFHDPLGLNASDFKFEHWSPAGPTTASSGTSSSNVSANASVNISAGVAQNQTYPSSLLYGSNLVFKSSIPEIFAAYHVDNSTNYFTEAVQDPSTLSQQQLQNATTNRFLGVRFTVHHHASWKDDKTLSPVFNPEEAIRKTLTEAAVDANQVQKNFSDAASVLLAAQLAAAASNFSLACTTSTNCSGVANQSGVTNSTTGVLLSYFNFDKNREEAAASIAPASQATAANGTSNAAGNSSAMDNAPSEHELLPTYVEGLYKVASWCSAQIVNMGNALPGDDLVLYGLHISFVMDATHGASETKTMLVQRCKFCMATQIKKCKNRQITSGHVGLDYETLYDPESSAAQADATQNSNNALANQTLQRQARATKYEPYFDWVIFEYPYASLFLISTAVFIVLAAAQVVLSGVSSEFQDAGAWKNVFKL
ncbi:unnamed protein product [Amoebophrya sp. A120]|nr:unnamed protein product [Amoebophrya sp. A120]|eukprot:GSA120T00022407001.1